MHKLTIMYSTGKQAQKDMIVYQHMGSHRATFLDTAK